MPNPLWVSWDEIYKVRDAFPGSNVAMDEEHRRVLVLPGQIHVTYDRLGVLITKEGGARRSLAPGVSPDTVIAEVTRISPK